MILNRWVNSFGRLDHNMKGGRSRVISPILPSVSINQVCSMLTIYALMNVGPRLCRDTLKQYMHYECKQPPKVLDYYHPELSGCITTLTVRNIPSDKCRNLKRTSFCFLHVDLSDIGSHQGSASVVNTDRHLLVDIVCLKN